MPTVHERPRTGGSWKISAVLGIAAAITAPAVTASALLAPSIVMSTADRSRPVVAEKRTKHKESDDDEMSVTEMIKAVFGSRAGEALRVARCESRYNPNARSGSYVGVFQIHRRTHAWRIKKVGGKDLFDPMTNVRVAHSLMKDKGWGPWTCARWINRSGSGSGSGSSGRSRRYEPAPTYVDVYPSFTYNSEDSGPPAPRAPRRPGVAT